MATMYFSTAMPWLWCAIVICSSLTHFASCASDVTETDDMALVKAQLNRLESQGQSLETHIRGLEQQQRIDNNNVESQVTSLESQVTCLEQTVQGLTVDNTKLKNQLEISNSKLKESIAKCNVQMDVLQNDIHNLQHDLNASTTDSSGFVAFYVRRESGWGPVTIPTQIPYEIVNMNIGAAWDSDTYVFTAPVGGIYHFDYAHEGGVVFLMINGGYYQEVYIDSPSLHTGSSGATIQLQAGDQVWIELYSDNVAYIHCQIYGYECSFSGFLVYEII